MRLPVRSDHACAVDREHDMQVGERNVVDELVVSALQKRRIHRKDRDQSLLCHACCHCRRVTFRNTDVEKTFGILRGKAAKSRPVRHRRRDGAHAPVLRRKRTERFAENRGKVLFFLPHDAAVQIKRLDAVIELRLAFGRTVALSLDGIDMHKHRAVQLFRPPQRVFQLLHIMTVHRSQIGKAHVLKHGGIR